MSNRKEPTWKEALRAAGKEVNKKLRLVKQVIFDISKEINCPYCSYLAKDKKDLRDHLTYYHWMSVPGVDEIMKEVD